MVVLVVALVAIAAASAVYSALTYEPPADRRAYERQRRERVMTTDERSRAHLSDSSEWSNWPVQTVKRPIEVLGAAASRRGSGQSHEVGLVVDVPRDSTMTAWHVYRVNLWALSSTIPMWVQLHKAERYEYETLDALLEDGWVVD